MDTLQEYREQLERCREELENNNYDAEEEVLNLESKIEQEIDSSFNDREAQPFKSLWKELRSMKKEFDFYDAEGELDRMFPDRHDEDFDEDSMSYDSAFGGD